MTNSTHTTTTPTTPTTPTDGTATEAAPAPALSPDDPRAVFARAVALGGAVIDSVRPDQLHLPTPTDMDVRGLLEHLVMVLRRVTLAGRGRPTSEWPRHASDVADHEFGQAWRSAAHEVQAAWLDDTTLDRPTQVPWGTFTGGQVLAIYTNEVTVHTWDLAKATGQTPEWDPSVLAVAHTAIHDQLPVADRAPMWEAIKASLLPGVPWEDPFGPAVWVRDDAPAIDRLVAWNGRQP